MIVLLAVAMMMGACAENKLQLMVAMMNQQCPYETENGLTN